MSSRTVSRFALVGWLAVALATPAAAQEARAEAPMPRAKAPAGFAIELEFLWWDKEPAAVAPMPRAKADDSDELDASFRDLRARVLEAKTGSFPIGVAPMPQPVPPELPVPPMPPGARIAVPELGPLVQPFDIAFPVARGAGDNRQILSFGVGVFGSACKPEPVRPAALAGGFGSYCAPGIPRLVAPPPLDGPQFLKCDPLTLAPQPAAPLPCQMPRCGTAVMIESWVANPRPLVAAAPANALCGTWYRELPGVVVAATFTHDELKLCVTQTEGGHTATITVTAHYTLTADGLVYGAVTGVDADVASGARGESPFAAEWAELSSGLQAVIDAPFSFRAKATSAGLMASALKCGPQVGKGEMDLFGGLYKSAKGGTAPAPKAVKADNSSVGAAIGAATGTPTSGALSGGTAGTATGALIGDSLDRPKAATRGKCDSAFNPNDRPVAGPTHPHPVPPAAGPRDRSSVNPPAREEYFLPPGQSVERIGIDFNTNPPTMSLPCPPHPAGADSFGPPFLSKIPYLNRLFENVGPVAPPCQLPMPHPVRPAGCDAPGDASKAMAADAFAQLFQPPGTRFGGMTLPTPKYLEHYPQYFAPDPTFPLPRELASQEDPDGAARRGGTVPPTGAPAHATYVPAPNTPSFVGTWCRDVAGKQCVVKVSADHLTLTVTEAHDEGGKVTTASLVFTADYHLSRDGMTAVGLITSVDVSFEGEFPLEDTKPFFDMLTDLQKALEDKPFALTLRVYDQALVIGNVRMPAVGDRVDVQPAGYMAGRFKMVGREVPKPKPNKGPLVNLRNEYSSDPNIIMKLPPVRPNEAPQRSNGDVLPPQAIPLPAPRVVPSGATEPRVPPMSAPTMPVPQMPQPVPPGEPKAEGKAPGATEMAVGWQNSVAHLPDPTRGGRTSPGVAGQMFLYGGPKLEFVEPNGTLTVDLVDETPRPKGQPAATPERWQFDADTLKKLRTQDETFGKSCTLFLPWPAYTSDITKVRVSARYDPDSGHTLFATPSTIVFAAKAEPTMPQPVPPGQSRTDEPKPARASARVLIPGVRTDSYSEDPNVRMRQLLYESEDLRDERRRFWRNDGPGHLTPERIHGGIY